MFTAQNCRRHVIRVTMPPVVQTSAQDRKDASIQYHNVILQTMEGYVHVNVTIIRPQTPFPSMHHRPARTPQHAPMQSRKPNANQLLMNNSLPLSMGEFSSAPPS
jgi:hypothetical protein